MCPACISTVALIAASAAATATGGLGALVLTRLRAGTGAKKADPETRTDGD